MRWNLLTDGPHTTESVLMMSRRCLQAVFCVPPASFCHYFRISCFVMHCLLKFFTASFYPPLAVLLSSFCVCISHSLEALCLLSNNFCSTSFLSPGVSCVSPFNRPTCCRQRCRNPPISCFFFFFDIPSSLLTHPSRCRG